MVRIEGESTFDRARAKNAGAQATRTDWICLIDADIVPISDFAARLHSLVDSNNVYRSNRIVDGMGGTILFERTRFELVGGHDPMFEAWGEEDDDLVDALRFAGAELKSFPAEWLEHREHDDDARTRMHTITDRRHSQLRNRIYRAAKWDMARILGRPLDENERQSLSMLVRAALDKLPYRESPTTHNNSGLSSGNSSEIVIDLGSSVWTQLGQTCVRQLRYRLQPLDR